MARERRARPASGRIAAADEAAVIAAAGAVWRRRVGPERLSATTAAAAYRRASWRIFTRSSTTGALRRARARFGWTTGTGTGTGTSRDADGSDPSPPVGRSRERAAWALYWELLRRAARRRARGPRARAHPRARSQRAARRYRRAFNARVVHRVVLDRARGRPRRRRRRVICSRLHRRFGPVGGSTAWENSRVAQKLRLSSRTPSRSRRRGAGVDAHPAPRSAVLVPVGTRLRHFHSTAFGTSRSVTWVQEQRASAPTSAPATATPRPPVAPGLGTLRGSA